MFFFFFIVLRRQNECVCINRAGREKWSLFDKIRPNINDTALAAARNTKVLCAEATWWLYDVFKALSQWWKQTIVIIKRLTWFSILRVEKERFQMSWHALRGFIKSGVQCWSDQTAEQKTDCVVEVDLSAQANLSSYFCMWRFCDRKRNLAWHSHSNLET